MWIYSESDTTAINMDHVVLLRLKGDSDEVLVLATTLTEDDVILRSFPSGGAARDYIKDLMIGLNNREGKVPTNYGDLE